MRMHLPALFFRCDPAATRTQDLEFRRLSLYPAELQGLCFVGAPRFELGISCSQSRRDNRASLCPATLKKTPCGASLWRRRGDSNPRYPNRVRQFSKLLVSATHPPLRVFDLAKKHRFLSLSKARSSFEKRVQKYEHFFNWQNFFSKYTNYHLPTSNRITSF